MVRQTTEHSELPNGLPMLARGKHTDPSQGGCVMEITSLLAGERWSDHPRCTHQLLAQLARSVNDRLDADTRSRLQEWVPLLVGANRKHPLVTASLVGVVARHGLAARPRDRQLAHAARRARRRAAAWRSGRRRSRAWLRVSDPFFADTGASLLPSVLSVVATARGPEAVAALFTRTVTAYWLTIERLATLEPGEHQEQRSALAASGTGRVGP